MYMDVQVPRKKGRPSWMTEVLKMQDAIFSEPGATAGGRAKQGAKAEDAVSG